MVSSGRQDGSVRAETKPGQRLRRIDIFSQSENLKCAAKHFRMKKRLKRALCFWIGTIFQFIAQQVRHDPRQEMMLIGETRDPQPVRFRAFGDVSPVDMHADVGLPNLLEGRVKMPMVCARLNHFAKMVSRESVIDRDDKSAL